MGKTSDPCLLPPLNCTEPDVTLLNSPPPSPGLLPHLGQASSVRLPTHYCCEGYRGRSDGGYTSGSPLLIINCRFIKDVIKLSSLLLPPYFFSSARERLALYHSVPFTLFSALSIGMHMDRLTCFLGQTFTH